MTYRLWQTVKYPYTVHPLYIRLDAAQSSPRFAQNPKHNQLSYGEWATIFFAMTFFGVFTIGSAVLAALLITMPVVFASIGTFCGILLLLHASNMIGRQVRTGRSDLFRLTRLGLPGMMWAICSFTFHRRGFLRNLREKIHNIYLTLMLFLTIPTLFMLMLYMMSALGGTNREINSEVTESLIAAYSILIIADLDLMQSMYIAAFLSMIVPTFSADRAESRGLAIGAYLATQSLVFAGFGLIVLVILPAFDVPSALFTTTSPSFTHVGLFLLMREVVLFGLWRLLLRRIDSTPVEFRQITGL